MQIKDQFDPGNMPIAAHCVDYHCCCKGILVPKNAQIATSFTPCSIICVNFLRPQKCLPRGAKTTQSFHTTCINVKLISVN